jgi:hypothetical protein
MISGVAINWIVYARAMGGIFTVVLTLLLIRYKFRNSRGGGYSVRNRLRLSIPIIVAGLGAILIPVYSILAGQGLFGSLEEERSVVQSSAGKQILGEGLLGQYFGLLLGGRNEIVVSSQAIVDSPLIGHGSWARNIEYLDLYASLSGISVDTYRQQAAGLFDTAVIPTHSHFFGAWVDGGLGGAICWAIIAWIFFDALIATLFIQSRLVPLLMLIFVLQLWDIIFSPFGAERRFTEAFFLVCACFSLQLFGSRVMPYKIK